MRKHSLFTGALAVAALFFSLASAPAAQAASKLNVVATTEDLASLTREVGGDHVEVEAIARGYQDPHFVEAKPSFILKLNRADLLIAVGLQLEIGWLPPLVTQSRNPRIQLGTPGYLEVAQFCDILEIPSGQITRAMGDVHPLGNPHYWLDPENGRRIAQGIANKLANLRPQEAGYFQQRFQDFSQRLAAAEKAWNQRMAPYRGRKIVTYHKSWPNFTKRFGLEVIDYVEPKPGIPPSPSHTLELINMMRRENIKLILVEPYFDLKTPNAVARETGGEVLVLLPSVGGEKEVTDYFKLFDYDINLLTAALERHK
ncbi:MAG TPA: metal ABC transporter substrate-binding protein [Candidatus Acidoferrales bacterium]|nr:metal ABC transporter substrate-binding protein [Candidatus Acidoferrales bacterium]